jgi:HNH endonuclease
VSNRPASGETKLTRKQEQAQLLGTARVIALQLRRNGYGTRLRIRPLDKMKPFPTDTDGWGVEIGSIGIGSLGKGRASLTVWLDRFSTKFERTLSASFCSADKAKVKSLCHQASRSIGPVRHLTDADLLRKPDGRAIKPYELKEGLRREEFELPVLENYPLEKNHFLGIYGRTGGREAEANARFCELAGNFFLDVARSFPGAKGEDSQDVYPRCEDRKKVKSHLRRERSGYLAVQCKERDGYRCQICTVTFVDIYGEQLGGSFAEAHHKMPLGKLGDKVSNRVDDLITVCANCHRMLHRMEGKPGDVERLSALVRNHRKEYTATNRSGPSSPA